MKQIRSFFSVLLLGISLMMVSVPSFSADFQKGLDAFNRGDYQSSLREWRPLAEQGNASAQTNLGMMYLKGRGVAQSDTEAVKWYRKSAEQGNAFGQTNLGMMYLKGRGVAQSDAEAVQWFRKSAEQGNETAKKELKAISRKIVVALDAQINDKTPDNVRKILSDMLQAIANEFAGSTGFESVLISLDSEGEPNKRSEAYKARWRGMLAPIY